MHHSLNAAGVPHFYWMYGRPGPSVPYGCDGGHNFSCWNFALNDVDAADDGGAAAAVRTAAPAGQPVVNPRVRERRAGAVGVRQAAAVSTAALGLARTGIGNGWVRNTTGWNDLHQTIAVAPNTTYTVSGWVRTSTNKRQQLLRTAHDGRHGRRRAAVRSPRRLHAPVGQREQRRQHAARGVRWPLGHNRDTWIQVDDISVART